ncbi:MAG: FAD-dependent oxidoreductase [Gemmatimonadales bacterium]|nr:FAD-dependent oxidoreductase [Gemmatimonadales bacterium]NIN10541.1 FAD-dependent oxidoreductase [Gemmatimonadales bacterium]NIN49325.1 FAD-dependent oxidoreductase [Gemmatimonadales bacterium]NIP06789.1 FAD-dependent oxidoreductase [Gemmatimonadales bacterium]NIQ98906.1 FAD-dependent oxidoreductase [Gemmatimonadales bacterium]
MAREQQHAVVVGGGVIGICCAYFLSKHGARVTVLERDEVGKGASYGSAGVIAPGHAPINKPGRVKQALKSVFDPLSPLYVAPRWDPALAQWLLTFSRNCTAGHLDRSMRALSSVGHATTSLFQELVSEEELDCDFRREGYFEVYLTDRGLHAARGEATVMRQHGFRPEVLDGAALREREAALNDSVLGGIFYPEAATLNPYRFVLEMAERTRRQGAELLTGAEVVEILEDRGRLRGVRTLDGDAIAADTLVLATGAYGGALARQLGYRLPLQAAKGYHRDRDPREGETPALRHTCMLGENSVFCTPMNGFVRFAGTLEFSGINHDIRRPRLEQLTRVAARYLDGVGEAVSRSEWCGLRPCLPDGLPALGPVPGHPSVFVATGHAMLGLTLGPMTGKLIAEYIIDGAPSLDLAAFRADRFR